MREASGGRLEITIEGRDDGVVVLRAAGEVDLESAGQLAAALRDAGASGDRVVADLIGVPFMDSSGLKVLLLASEQLDHGLALVLSPGSPVAHLLEITGVRDRFSSHATLDEALGAGDGG
jgi:anti-anti-sigma factor